MATGELIKEALTKRGMTQKELADKLFVKPQAVSKWIKNESEPSKANIRNIYEILGIDLTTELVKVVQKSANNDDFVFAEIKNIDSIDKASKESKRILDNALIKQNYSHSIYTLLDWLVAATLGLVYHDFINKTKKCDEYDDGVVIAYLSDFFAECFKFRGQYPNELAYEFYCMGMDLFESFGEYKLPNHDFGHDAFGLWNNFNKSFDYLYITSTAIEFKTALTELLSKWGY